MTFWLLIQPHLLKPMPSRIDIMEITQNICQVCMIKFKTLHYQMVLAEAPASLPSRRNKWSHIDKHRHTDSDTNENSTTGTSVYCVQLLRPRGRLNAFMFSLITSLRTLHHRVSSKISVPLMVLECRQSAAVWANDVLPDFHCWKMCSCL